MKKATKILQRSLRRAPTEQEVKEKAKELVGKQLAKKASPVLAVATCRSLNGIALSGNHARQPA